MVTKHLLVLKNWKTEGERIVLDTLTTRELAEQQRKIWRRILGGKHWTIDRRPGLDTLDHLALTIETAMDKDGSPD